MDIVNKENSNPGMSFNYYEGGHRNEIGINMEANKNSGVSDHANEIKNYFSHEQRHENDFDALGFRAYHSTPIEIKEQRAISAQIHDPSYNKTRFVFKESIKLYGEQYNMIFYLIPIFSK